jgi:glycosyltransferase involved in cell wall biosynthesis
VIRAPSGSAFLTALDRRVRQVMPLLAEGGDPPEDLGDLLEAAGATLQAHPSPDRVWLLYSAVTAALPTSDSVLDGTRRFELDRPADVMLWLLDEAVRLGERSTATRELRMVTDRVLVDVDHSARHDLHTGIQQVTRQLMRRWIPDHEALPVVWTDSCQLFRTLTERELRRLERYDDGAPYEIEWEDAALVLPWHTTVVLPEVPPKHACQRLAGLAQHSGNKVVAIGHDCIPVVSADFVPWADSARFADYLTVVKHARRVAGVSRSAASEFSSFASALPAQGLRGPEVTVCQEPIEAVKSGDRDGARPSISPAPGRPTAGLPLVLSVGAFEPRKNQLGIVYACERLWREGLRFELLLIGGSGWGTELPQRVSALRKRGRVVSIRSKVTDDELVQAYQRAAFTVFPSFHEGFGLPVAESLSHGTPVITTDFGSTREIGEEGGALLVDPRDDEALVDAIRTLLTDTGRLEGLREEIRHRRNRTWDQYAADLWGQLVAVDLDPAAAGEPA